MASVKGLGVVFGVSSTAIAIAGAAASSWKVTGESISKEAETVIVKDKDGETKGMVVYDPRDVVGLTVYPHGASLADAKTANALPDIGDKCVITDADDGDVLELCSGSRPRASSSRPSPTRRRQLGRRSTTLSWARRAVAGDSTPKA